MTPSCFRIIRLSFRICNGYLWKCIKMLLNFFSEEHQQTWIQKLVCWLVIVPWDSEEGAYDASMTPPNASLRYNLLSSKNPLHYHDNFNCEGGRKVRWEQPYPPSQFSESFCDWQPTRTPGDDDPLPGASHKSRGAGEFAVRRRAETHPGASGITSPFCFVLHPDLKPSEARGGGPEDRPGERRTSFLWVWCSSFVATVCWSVRAQRCVHTDLRRSAESRSKSKEPHSFGS